MFFLLIPHFFFFLFLDKKKKKKTFIFSKKKKVNIRFSLYFNNYNFFYELYSTILLSKKFLIVQFFIIRNDFLGKKFLKLLKYKSIKCRVIIIVDNIGTIYKMQTNYFFKYNKKKILLNFRNHKKIILLDNKIFWIGGNNIGREYQNKNFFIGDWNDFHCKIINTKLNYFIFDFFIKNKIAFKNNILNKKFFYLDNYFFNFLFLINFIVKKNFFIMSPYIILDKKIINLIKKLKKKNIDINIYISYKSDNVYTHISSLIYSKFLKKYSNIYFLKFGFFHRKIYILDKKYIIFGSMNFDIRSIYINKESLLLFFDKKFYKLFKKKIMKKYFTLNIYNYKKKKIIIKFLFILSFLNYFIQ